MEHVIYNYQVPVTDYQVISLPAPYTIMSAAPSRIWTPLNNCIGLWYKTVNQQDVFTVPVGIYSFVSTCTMKNDSVWHVFYGLPKDAISSK